MALTDNQVREILKNKKKAYTLKRFSSPVFLQWMKDNGHIPPKFIGRNHSFRPVKTYATMLSFYFLELFKESIKYALPVRYPGVGSLRVVETETHVRGSFRERQVETVFDSTWSYWIQFKLSGLNLLNKKLYASSLGRAIVLEKYLPTVKSFEFEDGHFPIVHDLRLRLLKYYGHIEEGIKRKYGNIN